MILNPAARQSRAIYILAKTLFIEVKGLR